MTAGDPEVAAATLERDLDAWWATGRPDALGLARRRLDALRWVIDVPAVRPDGTKELYHVLLDGTFYDQYPPVARFAAPDGDGGWKEATAGSRWWPHLEDLPNWFRLHEQFSYDDGTSGQLLCFSMNGDYYRSRHSPKEHQQWHQGRHRVAATLTRIHEILTTAYRRPSGEAT